MDKQLIEEYAACGPRLRQAVTGLTRDELTARPGPGKWSILELVLHLTDSDCIAIDRMKRMLTEDNPPLLYADETAYVDRLFSHEQSLEDALTLFELGRRQFARVLRKLPDEAFERRAVKKMLVERGRAAHDERCRGKSTREELGGERVLGGGGKGAGV